MNLLHQLTPTLMMEADKLEARYYGEEHMAGWQKSIAWQERFPWSSSFMEADGEIVAFVDLMPVHWDFFDKLMKGDTDTDQLDEGDIVDLAVASPGAYPLLLLTVVVAEEYRGQGLIHKLLSDRIGFYNSLQGQGFSFPVVGTENFTEDGCAFSSRQGWALLLEKSPTHRIYQVDWAAFQKMWG